MVNLQNVAQQGKTYTKQILDSAVLASVLLVPTPLLLLIHLVISAVEYALDPHGPRRPVKLLPYKIVELLDTKVHLDPVQLVSSVVNK